MNKILLRFSAVIFLGVVTSSYAHAQNTVTDDASGHHGKAKTLEKQERRTDRKIAKAEKKGKLTGQQATELKQKQSAIESEKAQDMAKNNGQLSKSDAKHLKREEKQLKKEIKLDEKKA